MKTLLTILSLLWPYQLSPWLIHGAAPWVQAAPAPAVVPLDEAQAALRRAAEFQRGETPLPRPRSFRAEFDVTVLDRRDGTRITADIERIYSRSPVRMVTTRRDSLVNTDSTVGFDGDVAWFRDNSSGKVIRYTDDPVAFETDLEQLDWQLQLMPVLLDAAVLDALIPRLESPRVVGRTRLVDQLREEHSVEIVTAEVVDELFGPDPGGPPGLPDDPLPKLAVQLGIDAESGALWSFRLETLGREVPRVIELRFDQHLPTHHGLRVPGNIKVFEDGAQGLDWSANLGVKIDLTVEDEDILLFELDPELAADVFAVPG